MLENLLGLHAVLGERRGGPRAGVLEDPQSRSVTCLLSQHRSQQWSMVCRVCYLGRFPQLANMSATLTSPRVSRDAVSAVQVCLTSSWSMIRLSRRGVTPSCSTSSSARTGRAERGSRPPCVRSRSSSRPPPPTLRLLLPVPWLLVQVGLPAPHSGLPAPLSATCDPGMQTAHVPQVHQLTCCESMHPCMPCMQLMAVACQETAAVCSLTYLIVPRVQVHGKVKRTSLFPTANIPHML